MKIQSSNVVEPKTRRSRKCQALIYYLCANKLTGWAGLTWSSCVDRRASVMSGRRWGWTATLSECWPYFRQPKLEGLFGVLVDDWGKFQIHIMSSQTLFKCQECLKWRLKRLYREKYCQGSIPPTPPQRSSRLRCSSSTPMASKASRVYNTFLDPPLKIYHFPYCFHTWSFAYLH